MKKKIVVFTGAGISAESGIPTFRGDKSSLWNNYDVDLVVTAKAWNEHPEVVLKFHNELRSQMKDIAPNDAHKALVELEEMFDVTIVTQNIDDLHEKAGSSNILHLHGEMFKSRSTEDDSLLYDCTGDINIGDKCELGSQLRPHTVLFDEYPYNVDESYFHITQCDYLLVIGTSLNISYTIPLLKSAKEDCKIFYIDPKAVPFRNPSTMIRKTAVKGVRSIVNKLLKNKI